MGRGEGLDGERLARARISNDFDSGTTRDLGPFALETASIRARIAAERITIRAFLRACNSLVLLAPATSRFGTESSPKRAVEPHACAETLLILRGDLIFHEK